MLDLPPNEFVVRLDVVGPQAFLLRAIDQRLQLARRKAVVVDAVRLVQALDQRELVLRIHDLKKLRQAGVTIMRAQHPIAEFYREEFLKHHRCLQQQRPYYSESAITDVEAALSRVLGQLEQLSTKANAPQLVSSLLKKFDVVTGLSAWSDPKHTH